MRTNKKKQVAIWGNMTTGQRREARALAQALQDRYDLDKVFAELEAQDGTWATSNHEYLNGQHYRVTVTSYQLGRRQVTFKRRGVEYSADYQDGKFSYWVAVA